jgi:hypothetical protein
MLGSTIDNTPFDTGVDELMANFRAYDILIQLSKAAEPSPPKASESDLANIV